MEDLSSANHQWLVGGDVLVGQTALSILFAALVRRAPPFIVTFAAHCR
jgi:hypothetical protein